MFEELVAGKEGMIDFISMINTAQIGSALLLIAILLMILVFQNSNKSHPSKHSKAH